MAAEHENEEDAALPARPDFDETLASLRAWQDGIPGPTIFYGLSDLGNSRLARFAPVWKAMPAGRRASLLRHLADAGDSNVDLDYRAPARLALQDESAIVRLAAIDLLWEDESRALLNQLLDLSQYDSSLTVRAAAAGALGRFVLAGELGKLADEDNARLQRILAGIWMNRGGDVEWRRRALESLSNCGAAMVPGAIAEAWHSDDDLLRTSAVYAMGRSCDRRWDETVLEALEDSEPSLRHEAIRASGELEIEEALPLLCELLHEDDDETRAAAIYALGEIGGKRAQQVLEELAEAALASEDEALLEAVEDALGSASLGRLDLDPGWEG